MSKVKKEIDLKDSKVYKITIGMVYKAADVFDDIANFSSETLVAKDAIQAASRVKLAKNQYIAEVEIITTLTQ